MAWAMLAATAVSAWAASEENEAQRDDSIEMLRERYRLDREDREAQREYMNQGFNAWGDYGMGGSSGGMWNQGAGRQMGLLNPQAFRQQQAGSQPVQMPWMMNQQNNRNVQRPFGRR